MKTVAYFTLWPTSLFYSWCFSGFGKKKDGLCLLPYEVLWNGPMSLWNAVSSCYGILCVPIYNKVFFGYIPFNLLPMNMYTLFSYLKKKMRFFFWHDFFASYVCPSTVHSNILPCYKIVFNIIFSDYLAIPWYQREELSFIYHSPWAQPTASRLNKHDFLGPSPLVLLSHAYQLTILLGSHPIFILAPHLVNPSDDNSSGRPQTPVTCLILTLNHPWLYRKPSYLRYMKRNTRIWPYLSSPLGRILVCLDLPFYSQAMKQTSEQMQNHPSKASSAVRRK